MTFQVSIITEIRIVNLNFQFRTPKHVIYPANNCWHLTFMSRINFSLSPAEHEKSCSELFSSSADHVSTAHKCLNLVKISGKSRFKTQQLVHVFYPAHKC